MPLRSAAVTRNAAQRRGEDDEKLGDAAWLGILVRGPGAGFKPPSDKFLALGDVAVADVDDAFVAFTENDVRVVARSPRDVSIHGNEVLSEASEAPPVLVAISALCQLAENRIRNPGGSGEPSGVRCLRAIVSGNDLRGIEDADVLEIDLPDEEKDPPVTVVGNLATGRILIDGNPLGTPWAPLNLTVPA
jgi:hypothetical protein